MPSASVSVHGHRNKPAFVFVPNPKPDSLVILLERTPMQRYSSGAWLLLLFALPIVVGCERTQAQSGAPAAPPPPEVMVSVPVTQEVTDYEDFPGRLEAVNSIDPRARVTGYLEKANFREGDDVKKGDVLFEIDPRPYQAEVNRARANLVLAQAHLDRLNADLRRGQNLLPKGGISREEFDKMAGDRAEASAAVGVAQAALDLAELNLGFTKVRAPISGRISRRFIDPGNLVKADETILTSIVSLDPIYAYFDLDERNTLRAQRLIRDKKINWCKDAGLPVLLGLPDEDGFSQQGTINFTDNRIDPDTGTWRLRGLFANKDHLLSPGLFVRMRLPVGDPFSALLIAEQALGTDQGQKYVYVVDDTSKVNYRAVKAGKLHNGLRVISEGLAPGEKIVVRGLQRIRPGIEVNAQLVAMPGLDNGAGKSNSPIESATKRP
jgi:RND family efflux transporter MFP subunit